MVSCKSWISRGLHRWWLRLWLDAAGIFVTNGFLRKLYDQESEARDLVQRSGLIVFAG